MKITVAKNAGFCFGVKRAYDLACVNSRDCEKLFILGKLVHNNDVCRDLKKRGVREIKSINDIKEGTIIFSAHGTGPSLYEKANEKGLKIIDTTCPKVMKAQRLAKNYAEKGYRVIIFGDKKHKEVKSIKEWSGNQAKVVSGINELKRIKFNQENKYCLISQTTQNANEFEKTADYLKNKLKKFIYFNTICDSTDQRQKEIRQLAQKNDLAIIIGGKDSANSKMLFEIAESLNKKVYFIENAGQLRKNWFSDIKKIAVSAGASTPEWIIKEVISKINSYIRT